MTNIRFSTAQVSQVLSMDQRSPLYLCTNGRSYYFVHTCLKPLKHAASIIVYLAGVRSLHIENGFTNPLSNCLQLERVLRGIKRFQGLSKRERLPVTLTVAFVEY